MTVCASHTAVKLPVPYRQTSSCLVYGYGVPVNDRNMYGDQPYPVFGLKKFYQLRCSVAEANICEKKKNRGQLRIKLV